MKNKFKMFGLLVLTMIATLVIGATKVDAENVADKLTVNSWTYSNPPLSFPHTFYTRTSSNNRYVYCTDYVKKTPRSGITYTKSGLVTDNGVNYIVKNAFTNIKKTEDYFVYQTALWIYMQDKGLMSKSSHITTFKNTVTKSNSATATKIKNIVANAKKASKNDTSAPTISITGVNGVTFSLDTDKKYYVSSKIKVTSSTGKYDVSFTNAPKGTTYKIKDGYLYVYVLASEISNLKTSFTINVSNSKTIYTVYNYKPSNSNYQKVAVPYKDVKTAKASLNLIINKTVSIPVNKVDANTKKAVSGAELQITNSSGKVIDKWVTDGKEHKVTGLSQGTYTLTETKAPNGYNLNNVSIKFTIDSKGNVKNSDGITVTSISYLDYQALKVIKIDKDTSKAISGAKLQITNSSGKVIDSWVTDGKEHTITSLSQGTYTLSEKEAPEGYILNNDSVKFIVDKYGKVTDLNGNDLIKLTITNVKNSVTISKQDITTNKELPGATLVLKDENDKVIDTWVSTTTSHVINGLAAGSYKLTETISPKGYVISKETITFTIDKYGKIVDKNGNKIDKVVMYNTPEKERNVIISKQDITTSKELPGATLKVLDKNDKVIDTWVSGTEPHQIKGIAIGTYTLVEVIAPNGYILSSEEIKFTIDKDGNVLDKNNKKIDKVVMYNTPKKQINIEISKQDITTRKELPGASLTVVDSNNKIIDTWISSTEPHIIKDIATGTYTLTETQAPNGYVLSTEKIKFTIDKDGKITDKDGNKIEKIVMYNKPIEEKTITISKQDITTSKELPGASLTLKDENGNIIDSWISENTAHKIEKIKAGTYILTETQAPNGYVLSTEEIKFTIDKNGQIYDNDGNKIEKIVMFNSPIKKVNVEISKQDIATSKELPGASLTVKDESGKIIDSWVSGTESHIIKDLTEGTYTLTETQAPDGYVLSSEMITFKIDKNGKLVNSKGESIDKIIMYNEKENKTFNVPIVKQDSKTHKNLAGATFEIKDQDGNKVDSWVSTVEAHTIELEAGVYTLTEISAPKGYILNNTPITFNVTNDGKITDKDGNLINTIIMNNTKEEVITKVKISKQDVTNGKELPGAHLVVKDKDGNVIDNWTSTDKPHEITGLTPGKYTLNELIAPNGYVLSDETITFEVKEDGSVTSVVMYNKPEDVPTTPSKPTTPGKEIEVENTSSFKNIASSLFGGIALSLGTFTIYKKKKEFN